MATEESCGQQASVGAGMNFEWDDGISSEIECVEQCTLQHEGCCVDSESGCLWTTKELCNAEDGGFFEGKLCSDEQLDCGCAEKDHTGCVDSEDEVYWFDSCGNPEEIAEDCDYDAGTLCKEEGGSASCASIHCESTVAVPNNPHDPRIGGFRNNGESWCTYESGSGGFYDRPGSRHYRHLCVNGEEFVEECKDFREEICVQADATVGGQTFSTAQCKDLDTFPKIDLEKYQETNDLEQSTIQPGTAMFTDQSKMLVSSITVDKGAKFWEGSNEQQCSKGRVECTVFWAKKSFFDDWDCEGNCECEKPEFLEQANDYCRMFGDCGADINILEQGNGDGLSAQWTGTGKGPHPTELPSSALEKLNVYGLYGTLSTAKQLSDSLVSSLVGQVAGTLLGLGVPAALVAAGLSNIALAATTVGSAVGAATASALSLFGSGAATAMGQSVSLAVSQAVQQAIISQSGGTLAAGAKAAPSFLGLGFTTVLVISIVFILLVLFTDLGELLGDLLGADTAEKTVTVECTPWVAPYGGDDCDRCSEDVRYNASAYAEPVRCSEYRCKSLGTGCQLVNKGTEEEGCVSHEPNDVSAPVISPWHDALGEGYEVVQTETGYRVEPEVGYWESFTFGIQTDELAQCKWDIVHTPSYDEMSHFFGTSLFVSERNMTVSLPGGEDYVYYVRCMDVNGNHNVEEYSIQFSTTDEPDLTPPVIEWTSISNGAYLPTETTEATLWLKLNEPVVTCAWNKGQDVELSAVSEEQHFLCGNNAEDDENFLEPESWSFSCVGLLTGIQQGAGQKNVYFMKCQDLAGNVMQQSYQFELKGSSQLVITGTGPSGKMYSDDVTLSVVTSGGAENGKASCSFFDQYDSGGLVSFFSTGGSQHTQQLQDLAYGAYGYTVMCEDVAGNQAEGEIHFSVDVDTAAPKIVLIYTQGDMMYVHTDEKSTCSYSVDDAGFEFDEGTVFGEDIVVHVLPEESPVYYIQCKDSFENLLSGVVIYA